jgi:hypothetical protein
VPAVAQAFRTSNFECTILVAAKLELLKSNKSSKANQERSQIDGQ